MVKLGLSNIVKIYSVVNIKEEHIPKTNIWKDIEDLKTSKKLVKEFKREYGEVQRLYKFKPKSDEQLEFKEELPKKYMAKLLYR